MLGHQHRVRPSPEGLWVERELKEGQLSLCDLRLLLPHLCVPMRGVSLSLFSPTCVCGSPLGNARWKCRVAPGTRPSSWRRALEPGPLSAPAVPPTHRRNKVLNHFSIMQQRRLKDQDQDEEDEEKEKRGRKKASELRIHDLEDDLEMSSDDSEASGEEGEAGRASVAGVVGTAA